MTVSGRVQGVFFRANTKQKAIELGLQGYAKNLSNGSVEVIVQGEEEKLKKLVGYIRNGPGTAKVSDISIKKIKPAGFKEFEIL